ncbi:GTP-binding protein Era [Chloroherpeton thalassium ATCC 35110]|uniref:GTPase Era n=1 Tax=Chloroherpeton thalassium (strain ATCC 35110 / GB-78) TaxID=517418 RepID=B3QSU4_CHLT3|nr:GTPase Era [Chloroherpeton thalassium]ACF12587.1 GTP-binding protein Era [Chloroherpeton thalassium ATCC 35110]
MNEEETQQAELAKQNDPQNKGFKAGFATILGEPNAGKSTLLNVLLGEKISIVTPKPQTTRKRVLGIFTDKSCQIVLLDTPGIMKPKYKLHEAMLDLADKSVEDSDVLVLLLDVEKYQKGKAELKADLAFQRIANTKKPVILVLNKVDLITKDASLELIAKFSSEYPFREIVPLSALKGYNIREFLKAVVPYLPASPPLYPPDILSTAPERFFVSEIIREKIFQFFSQEIPYSTEVDVEEFQENYEKNPARKDVLRCAIVVDRLSQKSILIGKDGKAIKRVGQAARKDIEAFLGRPVFLELFVKVKEGWREKESSLRDFGYK